MKRGSSPFQNFVAEFVRLFGRGKKLSPNKFQLPTRKKISKNAPCVLIFSPHPDDECIVGGLALRLLRESKWKVINIAVTLGSKQERKAARLRELKKACDFLGFNLALAGCEQINLSARKKNRAHWNTAVKIVAEILMEQNPRAIFLPHKGDVHPTHVGTHFLVMEALKKLPLDFNCFIVETEFWGQMETPNVFVELSAKTVCDLVAALVFHVGEIKRNPYHARLPAWMMDNVRRGAEIIGGAGIKAPDFTFGAIYRLLKWENGKSHKILIHGKFLGAKENPAKLFPLQKRCN